MKKILTALCCLSCAVSAGAAEQILICGKYKTPDGTWSNGKKLTGYYMTGEELSDLIWDGKFFRFDKYVVLPWRNGRYSYFKVSGFFEFSMEDEVKDQNGNPWKIKQGWDFCR